MRRLAILVLTAALLGASATSATAATSPQLIDAAAERGELSKATAALYLAYAVTDRGRLPERFRSDEPFEATMPLLRARRAARRLPASTTRARLREALSVQRAPGDQTTPPPSRCSVLAPEPDTVRLETEFFLIDYTPGEVDTLTIEEYAEILDATYRKEAGDAEFAWAKPPNQPDPEGLLVAPIEKYHVKVTPALGPLIFGFASSDGTYAGPVDDNGDTPWPEEDAQASCMGLNNDFGNFATSSDPDVRREQARAALQATVAHEFFHSIQFGYGGLTGEDDPDLNFSEGMATWMEDEVFNEANDNLRYLYPAFEDSMGEHEGDEYAYWLVWRGLVERFPTGVAGGQEDVYQRFVEAGSRGEASHLDAVRAGLAAKGLALEDAYHDFAVAARFMRDCDEGVVSLPFCFREADLYTGDERGRPASVASIDQVGGDVGTEDAQTIEDHFALNWIDLPRGADPYDVTLEMQSTRPAGRLRLSVACDLGAGGLRRTTPVVATGATTATVRFDPSGCQAPDRPVAVITNETQVESDPQEDSERAYVLRTAAAPRTPGPTDGGGSGSGSGSGTAAPTPTSTTTTTTAPAPPVTTTAVAPCTFSPAFTSVDVDGRGRRVRLALARRTDARVDVDVFQHARGRRVLGERLVARFRGRTRSFTWNGRANRRGRRVTDGVYSVRYRVRSGRAAGDVRRETLVRSGGRFREGRGFDRPQTCGAVRAFKLLRPVFGGRTNRAQEVTFMLGGEARVRLEVLRGGRVVRRVDAGLRSAAVRHRLRVDAEGLRRAAYTFRLVVQGAAGRPLTERLFARRL